MKLSLELIVGSKQLFIVFFCSYNINLQTCNINKPTNL